MPRGTGNFFGVTTTNKTFRFQTKFLFATAALCANFFCAHAETNSTRFSFSGPEIFPIDNLIGMLHAADLDGDGKIDLVLVNNSRSKINLLYNETGKTNRDVPAAVVLKRRVDAERDGEAAVRPPRGTDRLAASGDPVADRVVGVGVRALALHVERNDVPPAIRDLGNEIRLVGRQGDGVARLGGCGGELVGPESEVGPNKDAPSMGGHGPSH